MSIREEVKEMKKAAPFLAASSNDTRNDALERIAKNLKANAKAIFEANARDLEAAKENGIAPSVVKRLKFNEDKLADVLVGIEQLKSLPDPLENVSLARELDEGLTLYRISCPIGVIGVIFEARPDALVQISTLCIKSGNCAILKGGKDAIHSNLSITNSIRTTLKKIQISEDAVQLITDTDRETTKAFMKLNTYVDVLIPRGGAGLIQAVVKNATVPVIETGTGNCHIYVDEYVDFEMAKNIVLNAKTSRPSVCNAAEKLLVHEKIAKEFMPIILNALKEKEVEIRGDESSIAYDASIKVAVHSKILDDVLDKLGIDSLKDFEDSKKAYENCKVEYEHIEKEIVELNESIEEQRVLLNENALQKKQYEGQIAVLKAQNTSALTNDKHLKNRKEMILKETGEKEGQKEEFLKEKYDELINAEEIVIEPSVVVPVTS